jgi:hypothetical protein
VLAKKNSAVGGLGWQPVEPLAEQLSAGRLGKAKLSYVGENKISGVREDKAELC